MFTKTTLFHKPGEGGGSGGDQHNLGWYATPEALRTAHATASDGDWAIVGSTDTVWVWDTDTSAWKDSDQKGQVASVNGQTGTVVLTASDVGALPDNTHIPADPVQADWDEADSGALDYIKNKPTIPAAQVNSDWNASSGVAQILNKPTLGTMAAESASDYTKTANLATVATTGAYSDLSGTPTIPDPTQVSTLPTASVDELDNIYQFIGTTTASYTNGYFYKCVSDGQDPATYSWERVDVQPAPVIPDPLPSQTGQSGKFLTTDGTDASWGTINALQNTATGTGSLAINTSDPVVGSSSVVINGYYGSIDSSSLAVVIGGRISSSRTSPYLNYSVVVGYGAHVNEGAQYNVVIGGEAESSYNSNICIGYHAQTKNGSKGILLNASGNNSYVNANNAILLDVSTYGAYNNDANTVKIANTNGTFEIMSADGTIPTDRFTTTPSTDGAYVPTLTISSGVATRSWGAPSGIVDPHRVIDFQAPTAQNNYTWYRKYADGWVEQGGVYTGSVSAGNSVAITLAVTMSDANYTLNITGEQNSNNYAYAVIADGSKTTTGFSLFAGGGSSGDSIKAACWQVSGMAA